MAVAYPNALDVPFKGRSATLEDVTAEKGEDFPDEYDIPATGAILKPVERRKRRKNTLEKALAPAPTSVQHAEPSAVGDVEAGKMGTPIKADNASASVIEGQTVETVTTARRPRRG